MHCDKSLDAKAGMQIGTRFSEALAERSISNVHGLVVWRDGRTLFERYLEGVDWLRSRPLGTVLFDANTLHDLRSISKSIVALLYGIALSQGCVPAPEESLLDAFREFPDLARDARRRAWTVHHALTMTLGLDWDEDSAPYTDPANSEIAMDLAADRYRYVLSLPVVLEPGNRFNYCGGATALIARLITMGSGKPLDQFANESLFEPLGIERTEWLRDRKGEPYAASGLRMSPRDLARVGVMMLAGGKYGGRQVVPEGWIARCTTPMIAIDESRSYGYHWYFARHAFLVPQAARWDRSRLEPVWGAVGNGGQGLYIYPNLGVVVAITGGNYDRPERAVTPARVLREIVLPAIPQI